MAQRPKDHWNQSRRGGELERQKGWDEVVTECAHNRRMAEGSPGGWLRQTRTRLWGEGKPRKQKARGLRRAVERTLP